MLLPVTVNVGIAGPVQDVKLISMNVYRKIHATWKRKYVKTITAHTPVDAKRVLEDLIMFVEVTPYFLTDGTRMSLAMAV